MSRFNSSVRPQARAVEVTIYDEKGNQLKYRFGCPCGKGRGVDVSLLVEQEYQDTFYGMTPYRSDMVGRTTTLTVRG